MIAAKVIEYIIDIFFSVIAKAFKYGKLPYSSAESYFSIEFHLYRECHSR